MLLHFRDRAGSLEVAIESSESRNQYKMARLPPYMTHESP
jgi:hypothetical protein